jgi:hypothetical protein
MKDLEARESTYRGRQIRQLFAELRRRAKDGGTRFILVSSVDHQAGRTRFLSLMRREAHLMAPGEVEFVSASNLARIGPSEFFGYDLVLVDGPPVVDGRGALDIPPRWIEAFQGAVLVVVKRRTSRKGLAETREWLEANGIPIFGVVWNEWLSPPVMVAWLRLRKTIRRWFRKETAAVPAGKGE